MSINRATAFTDDNNPTRVLKKAGKDTKEYDFLVALAGNPNTGKSTVFNYLTGLKQHTGNWPGKTVARAEGSFSYGEEKFKLVDLPGTYSLLSTSEDEQIARDFILFGQPHVTLIVADATRLERNLNLTLQILEITDRAILVVNLIDEAKRNHISLDLKALSEHLRIPVCGTSARNGLGMKELIETVHRTVHADEMPTPYRIQSLTGEYATAVEEMTHRVQGAYPDLPNARWVALRLLEGDESILQAIDSGALGKI